MTFSTISLVTFAAGLGAGLIGGVFFAFSSFVLPALARLPGSGGLVAMQSINRVVLNRSFLGAFLGTAVLCSWLVVDALTRWSAPLAGLRLAGAAVYLVGSLLVTKRLNVPYNDALAAVTPHGPEAPRAWSEFVVGWSRCNHARAAASVVAAVLLLLGVSGCSRYWVCEPPESNRQAELPARLSETGLYAPGDSTRLADGIASFTPQFELWSDGAAKRRWIRLPRGERVDTQDMDNWSFPVGTQLWKEFTVDGVRVETRALRKTGPGRDDWAVMAYLWLPDGSDALAAPEGGTNVLGTEHDVPPASQCRACHGGRKSFVLGFSALQLAHPAAPGELALDDLARSGRLTHEPAPIAVPGNEGERAALGYLHANCGHCHNQDRPETSGARCYDPENELDFWLRVDRLGHVRDTPASKSARGSDDRMLELMSSRGFLRQMPPLGTKQVDQHGLSAVESWLSTLR
ncbi:MAG TPA: anthrone oxygenase family protein [Polyangiaceae bacterium]|nr:anthrone oxygenase family protein [Polyangiaceae bacterium]